MFSPNDRENLESWVEGQTYGGWAILRFVLMLVWVDLDGYSINSFDKIDMICRES